MREGYRGVGGEGGGGEVSAAKTHILRYSKNQSDISRKTCVFLNDCVHLGRI